MTALDDGKERVVGLIRGQSVEVVRSGETDSYGRTLGLLKVPAGEVGAILLREGVAIRYRPGQGEKAARKAHWCREDRR